MYPAKSSIECILRGGPRDGETHGLSCLDDKSEVPCDLKEWVDKKTCPSCGQQKEYILTYRLQVDENGRFEMDNLGRAIMCYEG